jgi:hypothetical protein
LVEADCSIDSDATLDGAPKQQNQYEIKKMSSLLQQPTTDLILYLLDGIYANLFRVNCKPINSSNTENPKPMYLQ